METILITGGIASGKSVVCRYLESKGYPVYDCDSRTKALYENVPGLKEKVEKSIGVPFSRIAVIFEYPCKREALEALVYPLVVEDIRKWLSEQDSEIAFIESAIALDKPLFDGLYDKVWLVTAPVEQRLRRNRHTAERAVTQRLPDPSEADETINNDSTLESLYRQIDNLI
ncbi:MAG: dephospho-CoA kinase [Bacteroidales bacterium]|nr:dephospho-CoA kinase [Bacteroidales bacterium]